MTGEEFLAWVDANREFINVKTTVFVEIGDELRTSSEPYIDGEGDLIFHA